ncbi:NUDIX hydrolase [Lactococcus cremoris]|uniref:NUDIX hydrolase n=1 Tax=Lactococcus TaxID=1357 RepID=UPI000238CDE6|nr:NUDIX hydrolase [Lactococcus cremoris]AEU41201.1 MutT/NudX family protein (putative) [Lactococcus cremoris subsp. cremoris A76]EQC85569.1 NUDIX hydrolase [Lactococcus cremoris subsp. cremoris TIFN7]MCT0498628.1 NUDIX hydrolase [Lactococcus cremoris]
MTVKLIAHALIKNNGKYLVIQRTDIKRGKGNVYPSYWDIPGGSVEEDETPRKGALRETLEEVNLEVNIEKIIHEDSNYDFEKKTIFTRLVYEASLVHEDIPKDRVNDRILLSLEEHKNYKWISSLEELNEEKIVPYLLELIHN